MPVVKDESEVVPGGDRVLVLLPPLERVPHNCDKHVQEMDQEEQSPGNEEEVEVCLL
jgi:hypothetical protein